jgi:hypothetical protein
MKATLGLLAAAAVCFAPSAALAAPGTAKGPPAPLSISPAHATQQPSQSCEDLGNQPGNAFDASGSAFNFVDGTAGTVYAGNNDPINDKNTASVSQYDVACEMNNSPQFP